MEKLFEKYSSIHKSIIIKTEALRLGVRFTDRSLDAIKEKGVVKKGLALFSYNIKTQGGRETEMPESFKLMDGTCIQTRPSSKSPYIIDRVEDKFMLCENHQPITEVDFFHAPEPYLKKLSDGTLVSELFPVFSDYIGLRLLRYCEMWKYGVQCKFCDINVAAEGRSKVAREKREKYKICQDPHQIAEAVYLMIQWPSFRHIHITGGSILTQIKKKNEIEFYCEYLNAIKDRIKTWVPASIQTVAKEEEDYLKIAETGIPSHSANIEVWDPKLFKILCPGKEKFIGRDEWINRMIKSVNIFGEGNIISTFVAGVEMAMPWGFKDVDSAVKSTLEGFEYLITHGIVPKMDFWAIESGSSLAGQEPPPTEYYIEVVRGWADLLRKYGLPPAVNYCWGCYAISTERDWLRFH